MSEAWAGESGPIRCRDGALWDVLCLPARADRLDDPLGRIIGDYLWPEWFDREHWEQFERIPRTWSALYQQKPAPETGDLFEAAWLKTYERGPNFKAWCETLTIGARGALLARPPTRFRPAQLPHLVQAHH